MQYGEGYLESERPWKEILISFIGHEMRMSSRLHQQEQAYSVIPGAQSEGQSRGVPSFLGAPKPVVEMPTPRDTGSCGSALTFRQRKISQKCLHQIATFQHKGKVIVCIEALFRF